jgi:RimJ/RimL family protein N-acetyltransferase
MSSYQVRPATSKDAKAVAQVHIAAWKAAYTGLMPDEHLNSHTLEKRQAFWREAIEFSEPQLLVAEDEDGKLVGFCGFDRSRDKATPSTTGEIWAFYAEPALWDEGVGLALWDATLEACIEEGFTLLTLWVLLRNERALRFFELAGFKRDMPSIKTIPAGSARLEEIRLKRPVA